TQIEIGGLGWQYSVQTETNGGSTWVIPTFETQVLTAIVGGPPGGGPVSDWGQPADAFLTGGFEEFAENNVGTINQDFISGSNEQRLEFLRNASAWDMVLAAGQGIVNIVNLTTQVNAAAQEHGFGIATSVYVYEGRPYAPGCNLPSCTPSTVLPCNDPACSGEPVVARREGSTMSGLLDIPTDPGPPPVETPPPVSTPWVVTYIPTDCPVPFVTTTPPQANIAKNGPPYPLVVGQDPEQRGVDVSVSARSFPVIYTWYEKVVYSEFAFNPATGRDEIVRQWEVCEERSVSYDDPIISISASVSLDGASRSWVLGELNAVYPGAYLHNPDIGLAPRGGWGAAGLGTSVVGALIEQVQLADPGNWNLSVSGSTAGTPVSAPLSFGASSDLRVWLLRVSLTE
ncbi:MAG: hypothetical protein ACE5FI_19640, partial [Anaerolineales bacterium]